MRIIEKTLTWLVWILVPGLIVMFVSAAAFLYWLKLPFSWMGDWRSFWASVLSLAQVVAILVGGWWTWQLFVRKRVAFPNVRTDHEILNLPAFKNKVLLTLNVTLTNTGSVVAEFRSGKIYVRQIRPFPEHLEECVNAADATALREGRVEKLFVESEQIAWPEIGSRKMLWEKGEFILEPGESETIQYDFLLDDTIDTVRVVTYFRKVIQRKPEIGWRQTTLYELAPDMAQNDPA